MSNEQQGMLSARGDEQQRAQVFQRAQAMLSEQLAQREAVLRDAEAMARMRFEEQQQEASQQYAAEQNTKDRAQARALAIMQQQAQLAASGAQPDWFTQQRFQTDENIRQATVLAKLEDQRRRQAIRDDEEAEWPKLGDFGADMVSPYRGRALIKERASGKGQGLLGNLLQSAVRAPLTDKQRQDLGKIVAKYGESPVTVYEAARKYFKGNDERASVALWHLGYVPAG